MSQSERIFYIDRKLRLDGRVTVQKVSDYFEVSTRQVKRDIEYLRDRFAAPILWDSSIKAYRYEESFEDLAFADQNLVLSYVIMKSMLENEHYIPIYSDDLLKKISGDVPSDYREVCEKIRYEMPHVEKMNGEFFIAVVDSIREKKCLEIEYENVKGVNSKRIIECERLINYGATWYLLCWDRMRESFRTFHISRIKNIHITHDSFTNHAKRPGGIKQYKADLEDFLTSSFGIFKSGQTQNARVQFSGRAARIVQTQSWHPSQKLTLLGDEQNPVVDLEFPASDFTEVVSKLLSFGAMAKPMNPPELVELWKEEVKKLSVFAKE